MTLSCDLESNRVNELRDLLNLISPKIIDYVSKADPNSSTYEASSLGTFHNPLDLKKKLVTSDLESAISTDGLKNEEKIAASGSSLDKVIDDVLSLSVNTWNPGFLDKLYASNNPIGVISDLILSILNTNSHVYTVSPVLSVLENYIGHKYASLIFTDNVETCGGLTFSGGSWSNVTSLQIARSLKFPETKETGNAGHKFAVYTSKHSHYSVEKAAILLGIGSKNVFKVKINEDGEMDVKSLEETIQSTLKDGYTPLYINATAGTTVFGSYDPFTEIAAIAKKYDIWFHIDGSWGGNVVFSQAHRYKLKGSELANSFTTNPHKMLGVPTTCSFLLLPHVGHFQKAMSLSAPYLFHGNNDDEENFDLADGTMGCGRRADSFKFYMAWLYYGTNGFEERVDHAFKISKYFIDKIYEISGFELVLGSREKLPACLQVCFYYKPEHFTELDHTKVTRYISRKLHSQGKYLVDYSPNPTSQDGKGEFFRVVFNSPILTNKVIDDLVESIVAAGKEVK
ncbi:putative glutamate decarboxylase-like protein FG08083 [[Candida] railenensis]|uniref:Glutamate decarboxylase-like protein FG08083 n=1 Tax=[Candida] railenensis TaxID=45579 RepID=A0A9P0QQU5_9ASCO|nr:putative glutamate decarboxylase-like protein FG08083 [[Candida] railenensis]